MRFLEKDSGCEKVSDMILCVVKTVRFKNLRLRLRKKYHGK